MTNGGQNGDNLETMTGTTTRASLVAQPAEAAGGQKMVIIVSRLLPDCHRFVTCAGLQWRSIWNA